MSTTTTGTAAGSEAQLPNDVDQLQLDQDGIDQETCSVSSSSEPASTCNQTTSTLPTPIASSGASTPCALFLMDFINSHDDNQVPIMEICSTGDMVLNVCLAIDAPDTEGGPLARFRVSSAVLRIASHYVKKCLDTGVGSSAPFPTGLPLLWLQKGDNQILNLVIERSVQTSYSVLGRRKALATLLRILHLKLNSKDSIQTPGCSVGVMTALVAELACALGCVGPVVPWTNLWLTRYLPTTIDRLWNSSVEEYYVGIVTSFAMGDETAFRRWSRLCICYGCDSKSFVGFGYVWSVISHDIQTRRRKYTEELLAVIDQIWNQYYASQPTTTKALAHSVALGAFARTVHHYLDHHPPFVNIAWQGSPDDMMRVFYYIKRRINTVWYAFTAQNQSCTSITSFKNPADELWERAETIWAGIYGLNLQDYRPEVEELLDVDTLLKGSIPWQSEADKIASWGQKGTGPVGVVMKSSDDSDS